MQTISLHRLLRIWKRTMVVYFGPIIVIGRLRRKRSWNYLGQIRVLMRYSIWR